VNNSKTILALVFLMAGTLLTTTGVTIVPAAYAGGDNDDGNKQKAEDDSAAAIADCDDNDVERAGFDCIAIASDVEIEEETATLSVCKEMSSSSAFGFEPDDYAFTVTGNNPSPAQFEGSANCVDVTIGPGEYEVSERFVPGGGFTLSLSIDPTSDCIRTSGLSATGEIQAGETQECTFINTVGD
jgi:hypothetical protein